MVEEQKFPGTKGPGNKSSRERMVRETKVLRNEWSRERKFPIGTIRSWERKVLGTKSPATHPSPVDVTPAILSHAHVAQSDKWRKETKQTWLLMTLMTMLLQSV